MEVYLLTEKRIINAIIKVKEKWIDLKVILENNPYMSAKLNDKAFNQLAKNWINVVRSNPKNYFLNHAKVLLVDDEIVISTWNMSHSTFFVNRDLFLFIKDHELLKDIEKIFLDDYSWINISEYNENLVISPTYSRKKIETLIKWAEEEIRLYFPYLSDDWIENLLLEKISNWVPVSILVSKKFFDEENEYVRFLEKKWIEIIQINKYKMHSKAILVDKKYLFIWSINFSSYSIDKNREVWIIIIDQKIIKQFLEIWK